MPAISEDHWAALSTVVEETTGLHFTQARRDDLERGVNETARELGFKDVAACADWLVSTALTAKQIQVLASHLTVGETYFFRERTTYDAFVDYILSDLVRTRKGSDRRLRIWSAACCTGEEPYSLAMALHQAMPDLAEWGITILGTDINPVFLGKAVAGVYGEWSFRDQSAGIKERFFRRTTDGRYAVLPEIKRLVTFSALNLAKDVYPSFTTNTTSMDVIFCRNVLMYFAAEPMRRAIRNLHDALAPGGWLIVSPCEASHVLFDQFTAVTRSGVTLYRKGAPDARRPPVLAAGLRGSDVAHVSPVSPQAPAGGAGTPALAGESASTPETFAHTARAHANRGELEQALAWCDRWIAADKLNSASHYLRALILFEQGEHGEVAASVQRALYLSPDFVLAHFTLGNVARRAGQYADARRHFTNALHLLDRYGDDDLLPESDGLTAGRLSETIASMLDGAITP
jgi:chemotaxis protein methyltransferase CheR